ncbi:DMT family transporter [Candidatus Gracilibacteria bacterium]|nr:DMT family transporter [Candidatus Gracilibacteria bacterium]
MFFLLSILSMLGYSLQGTLLAHHARKVDGLSLAVWRNLSLIITMLPILLFVHKSDWAHTMDFWKEFVIAGICGALSLMCVFASLKSLPAGISETFRRGGSVIALFLLGLFFFQERVSFAQAVFVAVILISGFVLAFQKNSFIHLDTHATKGIFMGLLGAILAAISIFLMSKIARELNPFISAYIWESVIGVCALILALLRDKFSRFKLQKVSWREFWRIGLVSSPTLVGSGASALAVTLGPIGILHTIGASGIFTTLILSRFLYGEKIRIAQWIIIMIMALGIVGLKLAS